MIPQATRQLSEAQARRILLALGLVRREWSAMPGDFDRGWLRVGPRLVALLTAAQLGAARDASAYVAQALAEQGQYVAPDARVQPDAFAGAAADGRALDGLLYGAVVVAKETPGSVPGRLAAAQRWLDGVVQTAVADAGRDAALASVVARPAVKFVRVVRPPCCQRCAVLAGRVYRHSDGFQRHPRCDCSMVPQTVATPDAGRQLQPGDVTDLTKKQRQALADGDGSERHFNKVINDYQRKRGDFLPPTRVQRLASSESREKARDALAQAGYLAA